MDADQFLAEVKHQLTPIALEILEQMARDALTGLEEFETPGNRLTEERAFYQKLIDNLPY